MSVARAADFSFEELRKLLESFGYEEAKTGRASRARVAFINHQTKSIIRLHKPHPNPELKRYQLDDVVGISLNQLVQKALEDKVAVEGRKRG